MGKPIKKSVYGELPGFEQLQHRMVETARQYDFLLREIETALAERRSSDDEEALLGLREQCRDSRLAFMNVVVSFVYCVGPGNTLPAGGGFELPSSLDTS